MSRGSKEKIKPVDLFIFAVVAYAVIDYFNLLQIAQNDLSQAVEYIVFAEYLAFVIKKKTMDYLRSNRRSSRRREAKFIRLPAQIFLGISLILLCAALIEHNTQFPVYTQITAKISNIFTGSEVQAYEQPPVSSYQPNPAPSQDAVIASAPSNTNHQETELTSEGIISYIKAVFGNNAEAALNIARCESGLNPTAVGDTNLMHLDPVTGELKGDSVGIFQIRTGGISNGQSWNRARENGMSVEAFRIKLMDPYYNIDFAYAMFLQSGFGPWSCARQ